MALLCFQFSKVTSSFVANSNLLTPEFISFTISPSLPAIFKTVFTLSVPGIVLKVEYSPSVIFVVFESMMSRTLFAFSAIETFWLSVPSCRRSKLFSLSFRLFTSLRSISSTNISLSTPPFASIFLPL